MDINIVIGGAAGQGLNIIEEIILKSLKKSGYYVFASKEIMSRIRGGINTTTIRISDSKKNGFKKFIDILIPLNEFVVDWIRNRINENTVILDEKKLNFKEISKNIGSGIYENVVIAGIIGKIFNIELNILKEIIVETFKNKSEKILSKNLIAIEKGFSKGKELNINIQTNKTNLDNKILINGTQSVALGALAGNCNFVSFYPMSPSTGVAIFLAQYAKEMGIVVEQFEDEISAICASIGSWFSGARGFVTTSGGGFALMEEAISLAGMSENPLVIHIAQRPGPATGLPTRTIQADLNLVLNAGHGEFPRIIFAPSTVEDAFYLTQKSFNLADKYQIPVFILTDQFLVDSFYTTDTFSLDQIENEYYIGLTNKDYKRYEITKNGISIRGIPGFGDGIIIANGNEHDEWGDISENEYLNKIMPEKRMKKFDLIKKETLLPYFSGSEDYKTLVISWGSTFFTVKEAIEELKNKKLAHLHFNQIWPINENVSNFFEKTEKIVVIEGNLTGQFADLLKKEFGITNINKILKYNGRQFYVEEIIEEIGKING